MEFQRTHFVIRSSIDFGSNMNTGSVTLLKSAPGRSCDMMCESTMFLHRSFSSRAFRTDIRILE